MSKEKTISRRNFLKGAVGTLGIAALSAMHVGAEETATGSVYIPGTYTATGQGLNGDVTVTMTFDENAITDVVIDASGETPEVGGAAADTLVKQILEGQTADIDGVAGATVTSTAVKTAVASCIAQAKGIDPSLLAGSEQAGSETAAWRIAPDPVDEGEITETYDVEIGIVGLGYAGLTVYRAAAEAGANVLAVETQPEDSWWTVGHDIGHINSRILKERGIPEVDPVEFLNNWELMANQKANPALVMEFAKNSGDAVDWFLEPVDQDIIDQMKVTFWPDNEYTVKNLSSGFHYYTGTLELWPDYWAACAAAEPGSEMRGDAYNNTSGLELKDLSRKNYEYVKENFDNAQVLFGTKGYYLIKENDRVTGFIAKKSDGTYIRINTSKGVVLAGGGFGGNAEMCNDLLDWVKKMYTPDETFSAPFGRDGSSIAMGVWAGGRLESEVSSMNFDGMFVPDMIPGPLIINSNGERFQNEATGGTDINGLFMCRSMRGPIMSVYDANYEKQILTGFPSHSGFEYSDEWAVENKKAAFLNAENAGPEGANGWYCAQTLDELADYVGFDGEAKENFLKSVEEYNKVCAAGVDTDFGKDPHFLNAIEQAPYYAHVTNMGPGFALVTTGGFVTTNRQQVVDEYYKPIEGLYASGNTCGLRFGPTYITPIPGVSIGMAITLGRCLGAYLAQKD